MKNTAMAYAAGYLEGAFTAEYIWEQYQNVLPWFFNKRSDAVLNRTRQFFIDQDAWTRQMIKKHSPSDPLWRHIEYIIAQTDGLYDGYKSKAKQGLSPYFFLIS